MPWFRVDDRFATHPKALATSLSARGLWVTAGSWSSAHLTDGVVPGRVLASLGGTPELAAELVAAGLWKKIRGGFEFHDWTQCNPSREEVVDIRQKRADAGRKGGLASANRKANAQAPAQAVAQATPEAQSFSSYRAKDAGGRSRGSPPAPNTNRKPAWCGVCDPDTRLTGPADQPYRCPECHPLDGRRAKGERL